MEVQRHILSGLQGSRLKTTAKRYTWKGSADSQAGLTLLFTHCIGSHKEQWEPIILRLFRQQAVKDTSHRIREAWAFDWQSHGDAAILNREALKLHEPGVSVYEWTSVITAFLKSPRMRGHRIVGLGHSAGAAAIVLSTKAFVLGALPYVSVFLIEPTIVTREVFNAHLEDRMAAMDFAVAATKTRRDNWPSREHAFEYFKNRFPWKHWDSRMVHLLTEHGLEDAPSGGVKLKCDKCHEAASYPDVEPHFECPAQLGRICHRLPVHVVWGTRNDFVPKFMQESLSNVFEGRLLSSVTKIRHAGHLVVQEQPDRLAQVIGEILTGTCGISVEERPKL